MVESADEKISDLVGNFEVEDWNLFPFLFLNLLDDTLNIIELVIYENDIFTMRIREAEESSSDLISFFDEDETNNSSRGFMEW